MSHEQFNVLLEISVTIIKITLIAPPHIPQRDESCILASHIYLVWFLSQSAVALKIQNVIK